MASLFLGVFLSLGFTLTAHIFSPEHWDYIHQDSCCDHQGRDGESGQQHHACVLSMFTALSFDGIEAPRVPTVFWHLTDEYSSVIVEQLNGSSILLRSPRAPPFLV